MPLRRPSPWSVSIFISCLYLGPLHLHTVELADLVSALQSCITLTQAIPTMLRFLLQLPTRLCGPVEDLGCNTHNQQ